MDILEEVSLKNCSGKVLTLVKDDRDRIWIAGMDCLSVYNIDGTPVKLAVMKGCCIALEFWSKKKEMVAFFAFGKKKLGCSAKCHIFDLDTFAALRSVSVPAQFGRIRDFAISRTDAVFIAVKYDSEDTNKVHKTTMTELLSGEVTTLKCFIAKQPLNICHLCIAERRKLVLVSDRGDESWNKTGHSVDAYDFEGNHIRLISWGFDPNIAHEPIADGVVYWPKGIAVDRDEEFVYVLDEPSRVQKFAIKTGKHAGTRVLLPKNTADIKDLICDGSRFILIGYRNLSSLTNPLPYTWKKISNHLWIISC